MFTASGPVSLLVGAAICLSAACGSGDPGNDQPRPLRVYSVEAADRQSRILLVRVDVATGQSCPTLREIDVSETSDTVTLKAVAAAPAVQGQPCPGSSERVERSVQIAAVLGIRRVIDLSNDSVIAVEFTGR